MIELGIQNGRNGNLYNTISLFVKNSEAVISIPSRLAGRERNLIFLFSFPPKADPANSVKFLISSPSRPQPFGIIWYFFIFHANLNKRFYGVRDTVNSRMRTAQRNEKNILIVGK